MTFDLARNWVWLALTTIGLVGWIVRLSIKLNKAMTSFKRLQRDNARLFKCNFVILDGLKKLGCNGDVSVEYENMRQHVLTERGYDEK